MILYLPLDGCTGVARPIFTSGVTTTKSAYRQLLLSNPELALMVLFTEFGPTLWMNHVLLFGATGSVWEYGRVSDFLMHLERLLLSAAIFHYVDDFHGIEPEGTALSAFEGFEELNGLLGCVMKRSKRSPPAANQSLLGVQLDVSSSYAIVAPTERRRAKLAQLAQKHLDSSKLSPTDAGSFAGKAGFFATTCVGRVGRAATKPLFARQHATLHHAARLSPALRAPLRTFLRLAKDAIPRSVPLDTSFQPVPLVYADAYFLLGDQRYRGSDISNNSIAVHVPAFKERVSERSSSLCLTSRSSSTEMFRRGSSSGLHTEVNSFFYWKRLYKC